MQLFLETLFMMSLAVNLTEIVSFSTISRSILWTTFNPHPVVIRSVPPSPDFYQGIADYEDSVLTLVVGLELFCWKKGSNLSYEEFEVVRKWLR